MDGQVEHPLGRLLLHPAGDVQLQRPWQPTLQPWLPFACQLYAASLRARRWVQ